MKKLLPFLYFIGLLYPFGEVIAQHTGWLEYIEQMAEEGMDEATIENIYQELLQLENNPFDLNRVTHDQLNQIPLLSLEEAIAIADFLEKNRPIFTVFELRNVPNLEFKTVERIISFFYVGDSKIQEQKIIGPEILQYGRHELQFRVDKTLPPRWYSEFQDRS